jgi:hypothetical protein
VLLLLPLQTQWLLTAVTAAAAAAAATAAAAAVTAAAAAAAAAGMIPADHLAVGPCLCVEIKPKAGFMPTGPQSAVSLTSIKRQYPRFMLHQLLKHLKVLLLHVIAAHEKHFVTAHNDVG